MSRVPRWTEAELAAALGRMRAGRVAPVTAPVVLTTQPAVSRHTAARKAVYRGRVYDSKAEARRAQELDALLAAGEIRRWEPQPLVIILWPGTDEVLLRYRADFRVMGKDRTIWYEEVKGRRFRDWPLRERILRLARLPLRVLSCQRRSRKSAPGATGSPRPME